MNSIVNNDVNLFVGYDWNYVYSALSFDYTSGSKTFTTNIIKNKNKTETVDAKDVTITIMNSRQFYFYEFLNDYDKLIICPEIDVYYGSQNSINKTTLIRKIKKGSLASSNTTTENTSSPFMAYTFNLDLRYVYKKLTFNLSPYYTIPQKLATDTYLQKPFFVMYGGLFYTWKWEKK